MEPKTKYKISTTAYGLVAFTGLLLIVASLLRNEYLGAIIGLLMTLVAIDNFFCGTRAKACGYSAQKHYINPFKVK